MAKNIAAASGHVDNTPIEWILEAEDAGATFASLGITEHICTSLDMKVSSALSACIVNSEEATLKHNVHIKETDALTKPAHSDGAADLLDDLAAPENI